LGGRERKTEIESGGINCGSFAVNAIGVEEQEDDDE
jgi:hypothetical protein